MDESWEKFLSSGQVEDYLFYKNQAELERTGSVSPKKKYEVQGAEKDERKTDSDRNGDTCGPGWGF